MAYSQSTGPNGGPNKRVGHTMTDISELLALIPVDQIAEQLGVDTPTAQAGITAALPALLGGLDANAADPAGAASLVSALESKAGSLPDTVNVADIDTADGEKIVRNVFGENTDQVISTLGAAPGAQGSGLLKQLLPILAPIVLGWLAKKYLGGQQAGGAAAGGAAGGGGLADILGGLLGGLGGGAAAPQAQAPASGGGGLGDILGGLLGGGSSSGGAGGGDLGGLGDILGGLLGGGKR